MFWQRLNRFLGGLFGSTGVILAALTTHLPEKFFIGSGKIHFSSASHILLWHALALVLFSFSQQILLKYISFLMALGSFLFSFAVVTLSLDGFRFPYMAPIGGILLIIAWLLLAMSAFLPNR